MRTMNLLLGAIIFSLTFFATNVFACTCSSATVSEYRSFATAVFLARIVSKKKSDAVEKDGVEVTLKVEKIWKGKVSEETIVYTGATDDLYPFLNLCAPKFEVGERYVIFAFGKDKFSTDGCAGNAGFPLADKVIKQLGKGRLPLKVRT